MFPLKLSKLVCAASIFLVTMGWPLHGHAQIKVLGCTLTPDFNAVRNCIENKIDDEIKEATKPLNKKVESLQDDLEKITKSPVLGCRLSTDAARNAACLNAQVEKQVDSAVSIVERQLQQVDQQRKAALRDLQDLQRLVPVGIDLRQHQDLLKALAIFQGINLSSLNSCLNAAKNTQRDLLQLMGKFSSNPEEFPSYMLTSAWEQMSTNFDVLMQEEMAGLRAAAASATIPDPDMLIARSVHTLKKLGEKDPAARCLHAAVEPHVPAMRKIAKQVHADMSNRTMKMLNERVMPVVMDAAGTQIGQVLDQITRSDSTGDSLLALLPNQKELDRIIRGVAAEQLIRPKHVKKVADKLDVLTENFSDPPKRTEALQEFNRLLDKHEVWPEDVAFQVGIEILRFVGHQWIDGEGTGQGGFIGNLGIATITSTRDTVNGVVEAGCGLIPEAGAAICSVFLEMTNLAYNYVIPEIGKAIYSKTMHNIFDKTVNELSDALVNNIDRQQLRHHLGLLAPLIDSFPTKEAVISLAAKDKSIQDMQKALFRYNDSVRKFAETAASQ